MPNTYTIRPLDPNNPRELEAVTCFSVMTIWESRPELLRNPKDTPGYGWNNTHASLRAAASSPSARLLVAQDTDGHLVGSSVIVVRRDANDQLYGYFWSRYTLPRMRRQNMATRFLVDAESWFRGKGCKYAEVHAHTENHGLRALFEKRGYTVTNRDRDAIWSWVVLRRDL